MQNPFQVVKDFEVALCQYTGAPFAVTTTSATMGLLLALKRYSPTVVEIPKLTYKGVADSIINAGHEIAFRDEDWSGGYRMGGTNVWDFARRFTSNMYVPKQIQVVSFHWGKILGLQQGGSILHDDPYLDIWLRKMRFDGRTEGKTAQEDDYDLVGMHAYMSPEIAALGIVKLNLLPKHNSDLPKDNYRDLSLCPAYL